MSKRSWSSSKSSNCASCVVHVGGAKFFRSNSSRPNSASILPRLMFSTKSENSGVTLSTVNLGTYIPKATYTYTEIVTIKYNLRRHSRSEKTAHGTQHRENIEATKALAQ
uniref:Uncharacterized protein n=1 Tax=Photinus pyralis TaxID=7054 RepID=A0A1Y1LMY0_PHOPY